MSKGAAATFTERFGRGSGIYLVDFAVFKPPDEWLITRKALADAGYKSKMYTDESMEIMRKIAYGEAMGMGETTALVHLKNRINFLNMTAENPVDQSVEACIEESEAVMHPTVDAALRNAGIKPSEVDYVLTTNSTFNPVPSLSARVCNHFKMRSDCINYSISGHGCPSGILLIDMAKHILKANPNKVVLLVAQESILPYFYRGNKKEFLFSNVLFRSGGAAIVMSNRKRDARRSKYELVASIRVLKADNDDFHNCIKMREDEDGRRGVLMQTRMVKKAAEAATRIALTRIAPRILPISELVKAARDKNYVPDFTKGIHHLALHTAAKFVVQGVAESLRFPPEACQPCVESLFRFGNTSCASTYYVLANLESRRGIKRGERVLQMGMGSGFKCVMSVWEARRHVYTRHPAWDDNPLYDVPSSWTDDVTLGDANNSVAELHAANLDVDSVHEVGPTTKSSHAELPPVATKIKDSPFFERMQPQKIGLSVKETPPPLPEPPAFTDKGTLADPSSAVQRALSSAKPVNVVAAPSSASTADDVPAKMESEGLQRVVAQSPSPTPPPPATPQISPVCQTRAISSETDTGSSLPPQPYHPISVRGTRDNLIPRMADEDTAVTVHGSIVTLRTSSSRKSEGPATDALAQNVDAPVRSWPETALPETEENVPLLRSGMDGTAPSFPALQQPSRSQPSEQHPAIVDNQHHQSSAHLPEPPMKGVFCIMPTDVASPVAVSTHAPSASLSAAPDSQQHTPLVSESCEPQTMQTPSACDLSLAPECTSSPISPGLAVEAVADSYITLQSPAQSRSAAPSHSPVVLVSPASAQPTQPVGLGLQNQILRKAPENGDLIRGATASLYASIEMPASSNQSTSSRHVVIPPSAKEKFRNAKARFEQVARASQGRLDDGQRQRAK